MRSFVTAAVCLCLLLSLTDTTDARSKKTPGHRPMRPVSDGEFDGLDPLPADEGVRDRFTSSQVDTFCIVWYDFESLDWQGWTRVDCTEQTDTFAHVDDFSGLNGGIHGNLAPIEGSRSMWCGVRDWNHQISGLPGDFEYLCSWITPPGYGNNWKQMFATGPIHFEGPLLTFSYHGRFGSEPDCDRSYVEYDAGGFDWIEIAAYDGNVDTVAVHELVPGKSATKLRFRFVSDAAWSDEDGLYDTDGAFIVDSVTIADSGGLIEFQDFEDWPLGAGSRAGSLWRADVGESFGKYSGLMTDLHTDKDPCGENFGSQIVFFIGSTNPSAEYPGLYDTPFCKGSGGLEEPCQNEYVISPVIDITKYSANRDENQDSNIPTEILGDLGGMYLKFSLYADLPIPNLVFYDWSVRTLDEDGCPGEWSTRMIYYYTPTGYIFKTEPIAHLVDGDSIQIRLGVRDMCSMWYQVYGDCEHHTPSPWYDNVRVQRFDTRGPQWSWRDLDIFQDNFPENEFDLESFVRADCANDLRPNDDPLLDPGDSVVVICTSPFGGGIDTMPDGWPRVYLHVYPEYIGDPAHPKPTLYGPGLAGNYGRYYSDDGSTWTIIQCDYARTGGGTVAPDRYAADLNDSLFTRGYRVNYYFKAYDNAGETATLPRHAEEGEYFEWTCLPTLASDILYVDDFHGRGTPEGISQLYWDASFDAVLPPHSRPDRYDVNNPSSSVSNGPGSRAKNQQLATAYRKIIWDSGNLTETTISDGTGYSDKSDDVRMLIDWLKYSPHDIGLWVCGDAVASNLAGSPSPAAAQLLADYCGIILVDDSYFGLTGGYDGGGLEIPKVIADPNTGNPLWHATWGDSFHVLGTCPSINEFDVLGKTGSGEYALCYPAYQDQPYYAGIYSTAANDSGFDIRTMWFGFSFMYIIDCTMQTPTARHQIVRDVIDWMENDVNSDITDVDDLPPANRLEQNYPNPFNPVTTIAFSLKEKAAVSIAIYNVAGQLVRILVDEVKDAGKHTVVWDGMNNVGIKAASGIYLCRLNTADFTATRKMILLR